MMKTFRAMAAALAATAGCMTPALAITGNWVDDFEHPFVGLVVFYDAQGNFSHRCSGSLISPIKLLTAGHCTAGVASARVYFQQNAGANFDPATGLDPVSGYPETCAPGTFGVVCATASRLFDYNYVGLITPNTRDVGVVMLDQAILLPEYGQLPAPGTLDGLATARGTLDTEFTPSGYGLTLRVRENSALSNVSFRSRLMAKSTLVNLNSALNGGYNLQTHGNGTGRGGTCSGDSGGPVFLGSAESNLIVAVTSFGLNSLCRGVDFSYRIDRQEVLDWINTIN
jgi:hypothetical protein